jgi:hypothetical protein
MTTHGMGIVIAHHGYQRPGDGWQTASCFGARFRPYEVACDALPLCIAHAEQHLEMTQAALAKHIAEPPRGMTFKPRDYSDRRFPVTYLRPADFDPQDTTKDYGNYYSYRGLFRGRTYQLNRTIEAIQGQFKFMRKRLADWKPPVN